MSWRRFIPIMVTVVGIFWIHFMEPGIVIAESNPPVVMLDVAGNVHIPAIKILGAISNTIVGKPFDPGKVQLDVRAVIELGYFADVHYQTEEMLNGVKLTFTVTENPPFKAVQFEGLTQISPDLLLPFISQQQDEIFNATVFREDLAKALKFCQEKKGLLIDPRMLRQAVISPEGLVTVELTEIRYGKIRVTGLVQTKEVVIRRELSIHEGDIIDINQVKEEQFKLMRLRLFESVIPRLESSEIPDSMDLVWEVTEAHTGEYFGAISYAEETQEVGGSVGITQNNFQGLGQSISFQLDAAPSYTKLEFSYYNPWVDENHTSFGISLWNNEANFTSTMDSWFPPGVYQNQPFDMDVARKGLSVSLGRPLTEDIRGSVKLNLEYNQINDFWVDGTDRSQPSLTVANPRHPLEYWDNSLEFNLYQDQLIYKDRNFVKGGYRLEAGCVLAGSYLGGEYDYQKVTLEGRKFFSLAEDLAFGMRWQGCWLNGDYPDYNALYLGGPYRLRGFDEHRFKNAKTMELIGDQYWLLNSELRYQLPVNKKIELVLFSDIGQTTFNWSQSVHSDYGIGLHIDIPFLGLLRFDQAWNSDDEDRFVFGIREVF